MNNIGSKLWDILESVLRFFAYKVFRLKMSDALWQKFMQFVKFALVGLSNTIVSYILYLIFLKLFQLLSVFENSDYLIAQIIAYILSIFWAFYWNQKYVFKTDASIVWWKALIKSFISYSFAGVFLNSALSYIWVEKFGISKFIVPIINLLINIPVNFFMNKLWAFRGKKRVRT